MPPSKSELLLLILIMVFSMGTTGEAARDLIADSANDNSETYKVQVTLQGDVIAMLLASSRVLAAS